MYLLNRLLATFGRSEDPDPRSELEQLRDDVIGWRAERLEIEPAQARAQLSQRRRARPVGTDIADAREYDEAIQDLDRLEYPTTECLEPHEVEAYVAGRLPPERGFHVSNCRFCSVVVDIAAPSDDKAADFDAQLIEMFDKIGLTDECLADEESMVATDEKEHEGASVSDWRMTSGALVGMAAAFVVLVPLGLWMQLTIPGNVGIFAGRNQGSKEVIAAKATASERVMPLTADLRELLSSTKFLASLGSLHDMRAPGSEHDIKGIVVSQDLSRVAFALAGGEVVLLDVKSQREIARINDFPERSVPLVLFRVDDSLSLIGMQQICNYDSKGKLVGKSHVLPWNDQKERNDDLPQIQRTIEFVDRNGNYFPLNDLRSQIDKLTQHAEANKAFAILNDAQELLCD